MTRRRYREIVDNARSFNSASIHISFERVIKLSGEIYVLVAYVKIPINIFLRMSFGPFEEVPLLWLSQRLQCLIALITCDTSYLEAAILPAQEGSSRICLIGF
jgi:hypothetical protein